MELGRRISFSRRIGERLRTSQPFLSFRLLFIPSLLLALNFYESLFPPFSCSFFASLIFYLVPGPFLGLSCPHLSYLRGLKYSRRAPPCSAIMPAASTRLLGIYRKCVFSRVSVDFYCPVCPGSIEGSRNGAGLYLYGRTICFARNICTR